MVGHRGSTGVFLLLQILSVVRRPGISIAGNPKAIVSVSPRFWVTGLLNIGNLLFIRFETPPPTVIIYVLSANGLIDPVAFSYKHLWLGRFSSFSNCLVLYCSN